MRNAKFGTVIFDCDSTLSEIEGIEELAVDHRAEVEALTEAAMRGEIPLEQVYGRRLELVRPSKDRVFALGQRYINTLVPQARETVAALIAAGIKVCVVSGGVRPAVLIVARELGIEEDAVHAVDIYFDDDDAYSGFDVQSPLAVSGGKLEVVKSFFRNAPRPIMLVGDGATDLEAKPAVDLFVGFAGVVARQQVIEAADVVINERSLAPVIELALGPNSTK